MWRAFFERAGKLLLFCVLKLDLSAKLSFRNPPPIVNFMDELSGEQLKKFEEIDSVSVFTTQSRKTMLWISQQKGNSFNSRIHWMKSCALKKKNFLKENSTDWWKARALIYTSDLFSLASEHPSKIVLEQSLFSVYIHPPVGFKFPENHTFHGTEIENRVDLNHAWGTFRLVEAELRLMEAALKEKRNKYCSKFALFRSDFQFVLRKFVLLSETCVPLYPPEVIYSQLLSEKKSRVQACDSDDDVQIARSVLESSLLGNLRH